MAPQSNIRSICQPDFNLVTFNLGGFNQGILMLKSICSLDTNSVIFVQESWLTQDQLYHFYIFKCDYYVYGISAMDSTLGKGLLRGRPHGGVHMFVRKSLENSMGQID